MDPFSSLKFKLPQSAWRGAHNNNFHNKKKGAAASTLTASETHETGGCMKPPRVSEGKSTCSPPIAPTNYFKQVLTISHNFLQGEDQASSAGTASGSPSTQKTVKHTSAGKGNQQTSWRQQQRGRIVTNNF